MELHPAVGRGRRSRPGVAQRHPRPAAIKRVRVLTKLLFTEIDAHNWQRLMAALHYSVVFKGEPPARRNLDQQLRFGIERSFLARVGRWFRRRRAVLPDHGEGDGIG